MLGAGVLPKTGGLVGHDWFTTHAAVKQATDCEGVVADLFSCQANAGATGEKAVLRVFLQQVHLGGNGGLAVGGGEGDGLAESLDVPAGVHEINRDPVQQLGMRGELALHAEVLARSDDPATEEHLPDPVHEHAGGEGIAPIHEPLGKAETVPGKVRREGEDLVRHRGLHFFSGSIEAATGEDVCLALVAVGHFPHDHDFLHLS